jgi:hypothetical protein
VLPSLASSTPYIISAIIIMGSIGYDVQPSGGQAGMGDQINPRFLFLDRACGVDSTAYSVNGPDALPPGRMCDITRRMRTRWP